MARRNNKARARARGYRVGYDRDNARGYALATDPTGGPQINERNWTGIDNQDAALREVVVATVNMRESEIAGLSAVNDVKSASTKILTIIGMDSTKAIANAITEMAVQCQRSHPVYGNGYSPICEDDDFAGSDEYRLAMADRMFNRNKSLMEFLMGTMNSESHDKRDVASVIGVLKHLNAAVAIAKAWVESCVEDSAVGEPVCA